MNLQAAIELYAGGPGSGRHPYGDVLQKYGFTEGHKFASPEAPAQRQPDRAFKTGFGSLKDIKNPTNHWRPGNEDSRIRIYPDGSWEHKLHDNVNETSTRLGSGKGFESLAEYLSKQ